MGLIVLAAILNAACLASRREDFIFMCSRASGIRGRENVMGNHPNRAQRYDVFCSASGHEIEKAATIEGAVNAAIKHRGRDLVVLPISDGPQRFGLYWAGQPEAHGKHFRAVLGSLAKTEGAAWSDFRRRIVKSPGIAPMLFGCEIRRAAPI